MYLPVVAGVATFAVCCTKLGCGFLLGFDLGVDLIFGVWFICKV